MLWGYATQRHSHPELFRVAAERAAQTLDGFTAQASRPSRPSGRAAGREGPLAAPPAAVNIVVIRHKHMPTRQGFMRLPERYDRPSRYDFAKRNAADFR